MNRQLIALGILFLVGLPLYFYGLYCLVPLIDGMNLNGFQFYLITLAVVFGLVIVVVPSIPNSWMVD